MFNEMQGNNKKWYERDFKLFESPTSTIPAIRFTPGVTEFTVLTDGVIQPHQKFNRPDQTEDVLLFYIRWEGELRRWFVTLRDSKDSKFGQVYQLAKKIGTLKGHKIRVTLEATGGHSRKYLIELADEPKTEGVKNGL